MDSSSSSNLHFLHDQLQVMLQKEREYSCYDYIARHHRRVQQAGGIPPNVPCIDQSWRSRMCQWCYQVTDFCDFQRETVFIAMSYLDRYLCTEQGQSALVDSGLFQLAAMTCFYIAVKNNETIMMGIEILAQLGRGKYVRQDFEQMELHILNALQWRVNGPSTHHFIDYFVALIPPTVDSALRCAVLNNAHYQIELAACEYDFGVNHLPSRTALAAIVNAVSKIHHCYFPLQLKEQFYHIMQQCLCGVTVNDPSLPTARLNQLQHGTCYAVEQYIHAAATAVGGQDCKPSSSAIGIGGVPATPPTPTGKAMAQIYSPSSPVSVVKTKKTASVFRQC